MTTKSSPTTSSIHSENNRSYWLDALRVFAALAVVLLHVSASLVTTNGETRGLDWWLGNIGDGLMRWCVPVFVMITGSLMLAKPATESLLRFYRRRLHRVLIPLVVWSLVYILVSAYSAGKFDAEAIGRSIFTGTVYFHLWYLYMLLGLYLVVPFVQRLVWKCTRRQLGRLTAISLVLSIVYNYILPGIVGSEPIFLTTFPPYIAYLMAGYYIGSAAKPVIRPKTAAALAVGSGLAIVIFTGMLAETLGSRAWGIMYSYHNPLVILMSLCLFSLAKDTLGEGNSDESRSSRLLLRIAPLTLGIYVIHPLFLFIAWHIPVLSQLQSSGFGIPIITALAFGFSAVLTALLQRIPWVRQAV
jgi:surface polysaccharide O-acyltransferase-like enzyme